MSGPDANTAFAVALWDGLVEAGVEHACLCPGSRSALLAVAAAWQPGLTTSVHLDERSAGFFALGAAQAGRRPVALVCSSGTAAANFLPAVVEASLAGVPLIVLTADRPVEARGWGAAQTIDQVGLFGSHVRFFAEAPAPGEGGPGERHAAALALRAVALATGDRPGPVHLNLPFREPLQPNEASLARAGRAPSARRPVVVEAPPAPPAPIVARAVAALRGAQRPVLVAGPLPDADPALGGAVDAFSRATGWPVLAELCSQLRLGPHTAGGAVLAGGEALLRQQDFAARMAPDLVWRLGAAPTSKAWAAWLERHPEARVVGVQESARHFPDPSWRVDEWWRVRPAALLQAVAEQLAGEPHAGTASWRDRWTRADKVASQALGRVAAASEPLSAAQVVRTAVAALSPRHALFLSNSLAIRHADLFVPTSIRELRVLANRGANGIDGIVSSALGASLLGPTLLVTGDLAFLHDLSGLASAAQGPFPLVAVVLNDRGGGIFDQLPIASLGESVEFERLFRTPQSLDIGPLVAGLGLCFDRVSDPIALGAVLEPALAAGRPHVVEVPLDPARQQELQRHALAAVGEGLRAERLA